MKVLGIDQGTTSTKSFTLNEDGHFDRVAGIEHRQYYPQAGWVEHNPEELLTNIRHCIEVAGPIEAIGIDNQGETIVAWDSQTGRPCYNAIVWQDSRTSFLCEKLKAEGAESLTEERAGLPLDPYFSASKMRWIIDNVDEAKTLLKQNRLRIATSDAFFLDRLSGNFSTDVTTASRTSLMSLTNQQWDEDLLQLFGIPRECLPEIRCTTDDFGTVGATPVTASIVDQQAALFGHGCAERGQTKITFGTGAFALSVSGATRPAVKEAKLAATVAWKKQGESTTFALDGAVYNAASAINWVRSLGLFTNFEDIADFKAPTAISRGVCFVPALSGLACPYWDRNAAGLWIGMDLATSRQDLVQAVLEGIALRAAEVVEAIESVSPVTGAISIDGGLAKNVYFGNFLANVIGKEVVVASSTELTGLGTARMAMFGTKKTVLPALPVAARTHSPINPLKPEERERFAKAVDRAKDWHRR